MADVARLVVAVVKLVTLAAAAVVVVAGAVLFVALVWQEIRASSGPAKGPLRPPVPPLEPVNGRKVIARIGPGGRS